MRLLEMRLYGELQVQEGRTIKIRADRLLVAQDVARRHQDIRNRLHSGKTSALIEMLQIDEIWSSRCAI